MGVSAKTAGMSAGKRCVVICTVDSWIAQRLYFWETIAAAKDIKLYNG
jgi:hypothetical protein